MENRGRPSEQVVKLDKWVLDTEDSTWYYDKSKSVNGCYMVEQKFIAGEKQPEIDKKPYGKMPVAIVFKTSNRSNAKTKMKIWRNTNIDYINSTPKLPGVPVCAIILDLLTGDSYINSYKLLYNL
tara:strand:+ start:548 stop:922 length:375 start_codon:yes stop_codon:yes gene_type:complete